MEQGLSEAEKEKLATEWYDELLSKLNVVEVISKYVPLKKKGGTYWGCCPFHHEKDPSFAVNEAKQFYHCFGCKESGNAITFVQKMESIEFWDAVKMLAKEVNFTVPESGYKARENELDPQKRDRLLSLMLKAGRHYYDNLFKPEAAEARSYLKSREINVSLARKFALGYSINGREMIDYLSKEGYTIEEMKTAGIVEVSASGPYDVFNQRLIIPIVNQLGEVVAFGGRLLNPSTHIAVKYRNSTNTPIFDKSRTLFALNLVKKKKQKEGINNIIIAEGYMDVIMLHKAGFDTAIASMGTSLTFAQAKLIRNYCNNVYISYDGDSAGQKATLRGLDILRDAGLNVKVIRLPDGLDPDDLIKQRGVEAYRKLIDEALTLTEYKLEHAAQKYDLNAPDGKSRYAIECLSIIGKLDNPVEQEEYMRVVIKNTGYSKETLLKQLGIETEKAADSAEKQKAEIRKENASKTVADKRALFVIASLLHNCDYADIDVDIYPYLKEDFLRKTYEYIIKCHKNGEKCYPSSLFAVLDDQNAVKLVNYEFLDGDGKAKFLSCVTAVKREYLENEKAAAAKEYEQSKDLECLKRIMKIDEQLRQIKAGGSDDY